MSGDIMKFGPQWIRTLTNINSSAPNQQQQQTPSSTAQQSLSSATNNYQSSNNNNNTNHNILSSNGATKAEFRYGREEMLALFKPDSDVSEDLRKFTELFVEKPRMPMAMTPMSEEEIKQSSRSWNSDAVLRSSGKAAANAGQLGLNSNTSDRDNGQKSERGTLTAAEVLSSSPRGPPGSLTRAPLGEQRGLLGGLSTRGHPSTIRNLVGRGTSLYTRSTEEENSSGDVESRFGQTRQPNSLRARFDNNRTSMSGAGPTGLASGTSKPIDIKSGIDGDVPGERRSVFDRMPSKYSADNDNKIVRKDISGRPLQSDWRARESWSSGGPDSGRQLTKGGQPPSSLEDRPSWRASRPGAAGAVDDWRSGNVANTVQSSSWYVRTDDPRNIARQQAQNQENLNPSFSGGKRDTMRRPSEDEKHDQSSRHRRDSLPEWSVGDPLSGDKVGSFDASGAFREASRDDLMNLTPNNNRLDRQIPHHQQQQQRSQNQEQAHQKQQDQQQVQSSSDFDHIERAAEIMVEKWTAEEEIDREPPQPSRQHDFLESKESNMSRRNNQQHQLHKQQLDAQQASLLSNSVINNRSLLANQQRQQQEPAPQNKQHEQQQHQLQENQQNLVLLPFNHEHSQQWYYRDTQGVVQGPFGAAEMLEWYKAGYFVRELLVRRACDELFYMLGDVIELWDRIPFAPITMNLTAPPPITQQTLQFRAVTKQLELAASRGRLPSNAFADIAAAHSTLLQGPLALQQQQQVHPVLAAASLNQNSSAPPDQQANIRQIIEAAARQQQQQKQQQHQQQQQQQHQQQHQQPDPATLIQQQQQQQRHLPVNNIQDQNEMQTQLRQLLAQLKNREGFANMSPQEQQEVLVRQFVASRSGAAAGSLPQGTPVAASVPNSLQSEKEQQQAALLAQQRARMMPFLPGFLSTDQAERLRYQQELERRQKEEAEKQQQQARLIMEQRMKVEEEKARLIEEVQKQRQKKQMEENEKMKLEAEKERLLQLSQLKQQQLAQQQEEFKQQLQNQQRMQQERNQQQQLQQQQQQLQTTKPQRVVQLDAVQLQQQQQIERAKKAAQAQQLLQEQQQQQQQRKPAWSNVSKPEREPVSLATLQKLQEEEKERERQRLANQVQSQQLSSGQSQVQRQLTWANAAQQSKPAPVKTLAEIQKEEEERLAREKQRKPKVQPVVATSSVWNNAASHLSWKNPPSD